MQIILQTSKPFVESGISRTASQTSATNASGIRPTTCPCCGSIMETKVPVVDLNTNTVSWRGKTTKLRARETEFLSILVARYPGLVTFNNFVDSVWGVNATDGVDACVTVTACNTRNKLLSSGIAVTSVYGKGYRLEIDQ